MWMLIRLICMRENTLHVNSATHYLVIRLDLFYYMLMYRNVLFYITFHPPSLNTHTVYMDDSYIIVLRT